MAENVKAFVGFGQDKVDTYYWFALHVDDLDALDAEIQASAARDNNAVLINFNGKMHVFKTMREFLERLGIIEHVLPDEPLIV